MLHGFEITAKALLNSPCLSEKIEGTDTEVARVHINLRQRIRIVVSYEIPASLVGLEGLYQVEGRINGTHSLENGDTPIVQQYGHVLLRNFEGTGVRQATSAELADTGRDYWMMLLPLVHFSE